MKMMSYFRKMHITKQKILSFLLLLLPFFIQAQNMQFDQIDESHGLSHKNINCMTFDTEGFLWIGTLNGLNRYNGNFFEIFKPIPNDDRSISGSQILSVSKGKNGDVWVATPENIDHYDATKNIFNHLLPSNLIKQIQSSPVRKIHLDTNNILWIFQNNIITAFNPEAIYYTQYKPKGIIRGFSEKKPEGIEIFGEDGCQQLIWRNDSIISIQKYTKPIWGMTRAEGIEGILFQKEIVIITNRENKSDTIFHPHHFDLKRHNNQARKMLWNKEELWIEAEVGVKKIDFSQKVPIETSCIFQAGVPFSFKGYSTTELCADKNQNIWIGTNKHGINYYSRIKNQFKHIWWNYPSDELEIDPIRAICKTHSNDLWMGFDRVGIGILHQNGNTSLISNFINKNGESIPLINVRHIMQDTIGNIYIGFNNGLAIYNPRLKRIESSLLHFQANLTGRCYCIEVYDNENVIAATGSQINLINTSSKEIKTIRSYPSGNFGSQIRALEIDEKRNIWIGMDGDGIAYVDMKSGKTNRFNARQAGLSNTKVYALKLCGKYLWIGTNSGLNRLNLATQKIDKQFFEQDGLPDNIIYSIQTDADQNLWVSTNQGLARIKPNTYEISTYLRDQFFMDDAFTCDTNGNIYIGGYQGVFSFHPKDIDNRHLAPTIRISKLKVFGKTVHPEDTVNHRILLKQNINDTHILKLSHQQHTFSFSVDATPFEFPNNIKLSYCLEGWNANWQTINNQLQEINFTHVRPGNYTLLIEAKNSLGEKSFQKKLMIIIEPPFWQKKIFIIALSLSFVTLILLIIRLKIRQTKLRNKKLSKKVQEQTKDLLAKNEEIRQISEKLHEADQAKLRFFTNISHEFRTPLSVILGLIDTIENDNSSTNRATIKNNAMRLLRLINELIEFRKIDLKQSKLKISKINLDQFLHEIIQSIKVLADKKQIELTYQTPEKKILWADPMKLEKILYNLISNAIKYSPKNSNVFIKIDEDNEHMIINITDEGAGIKPDEATHIFDRFYRSETLSNFNDGHGIGLSLAKELTELMHGDISFTSRENSGTTFILKFKKGNDHFQAEEIFKEIYSLHLEKEVKIEPIPSEPNYQLNKILVIEDHEDLRSYIEKILWGKYEVFSAENGKLAMELLEKQIPNLILCDLMMPVMDGIQFCKVVKENPVTAVIPIIVLSAKNDKLSKIESYSLGIDAFIEKPFEKEILEARIESILQNRTQIKQQLNTLKITDKINKAKISRSDVAFWNKANKLINKNFSDPGFTIEILAGKMNMSRSTFYRKFKDLTGENVAEYLRKFRLQKAAQLIREQKISVSKVCHEVGFASPSQFRTKFKEQFGVNPSDY